MIFQKLKPKFFQYCWSAGSKAAAPTGSHRWYVSCDFCINTQFYGSLRHCLYCNNGVKQPNNNVIDSLVRRGEKRHRVAMMMKGWDLTMCLEILNPSSDSCFILGGKWWKHLEKAKLLRYDFAKFQTPTDGAVAQSPSWYNVNRDSSVTSVTVPLKH